MIFSQIQVANVELKSRMKRFMPGNGVMRQTRLLQLTVNILDILGLKVNSFSLQST